MQESELREEITAQWGGAVGANDDRYVAVDMLVMTSVIAWDALAHPPSGDRLAFLSDIAQEVGTRSRQPRTVLRKLIQLAEREHGWVPTESVLRAAGMRVPR